jgi:hypothetical protein
MRYSPVGDESPVYGQAKTPGWAGFLCEKRGNQLEDGALI